MRILTVTMNPALDITLTMDHWRRGAVNIAHHIHVAAGGKGINVASILADWGALVTATGLLGTEQSHPFEDLLESKRIQNEFVRVTGSVRMAIKIVDTEAQENTDFNLAGLPLSQLSELEQKLRVLLAEHDVVVFAGSLPPHTDIHFYAKWVEEARRMGKYVAVDTSGAALQAVLEAPVLPQLLKPNEHELCAAMNIATTEEALLTAAKELRARGAERVVVSRGEQGALMLSEEGCLRVIPPRVRVVSSVGAGDAMVAGMVAGRHLPLAESATLATAFSAGVITREGAHLPPKQELEEYRHSIQITSLDSPFLKE